MSHSCSLFLNSMKQFLDRKNTLLIIGLILGVIYGLFTRLFFDSSIATISYLILTPIALGLIPFLFRYKEQLDSYKSFIFIPWLMVITLFGLLLLFKIEDFICFIILFLPFFGIITLICFLVSLFQIHYDKNKNKLFTFIILPFLFSPIENYMDTPSESHTVISEIIINAPPKTIWNNIVEVDTIQNSEYNPGILNYFGIPKPINAVVTKKAIGGIRTGSFEGGLKFEETITSYEKEKMISFSIKVDEKSVNNSVFNEHVLKGNYFTFNNATYTLISQPKGKVKLVLSSKYTLTSKVNFYGKFWADIMISDFQDRLLVVIENRCEK